MSKVNFSKAFENGKALMCFISPADPDMETTKKCITEMVRAGADIIQIGVPFSDCAGDEKATQEAQLRALDRGCNTDDVFDMIAEIRDSIDVPVVLVCDVNEAYKYGYEKFFKRFSEAGGDGIVVNNLPFEEHAEVLEAADPAGVQLITQVCPLGEERVKMVAGAAKGFIYEVLLPPMWLGDDAKAVEFADQIRAASDLPIVVDGMGGITSPECAAKAAKYGDGVLVNNEITKVITEFGADAPAHVYELVKSYKDAIA